MHMAMSGGGPAAYNDASNWTLIEEFDTAAGDMAFIKATFGANNFKDGINWNDDGTKVTFMSGGQRIIRSYPVPIPWDLNSVVAQTSSYSGGFEILTGNSMHTNEDGTQIMWHGNFNNLLYVRTAIDFAVLTTGAGNESDMSRVEWEFSSSLGSQYAKNDFSYVLSDGSDGARNIRKADLTPNGNLDSFVLGGKYYPPVWVVNGIIIGTKISTDGKRFYRQNSAVELCEMPVADDPANVSIISFFSVFPSLIAWQPDGIYINPNNTSEVWMTGDAGAETHVARFATNAGDFPFTVGFIGSFIVSDDIPAPDDALAIIELRPNGQIWGVRLNAADILLGSWVTGTGFTPADYDFQWQQLGNNPNWGPGDPSPNIWVNGGGVIAWGLSETGTASAIASGTLLIRPAGGGATIDSSGVSLNVDTTP